MSRLKIYKDRKREWRWTLIHSNGKKLANGGEGYRRRIDMLRVIASLFPWYRATARQQRTMQAATQTTYDALR